MTDKTNKFPTFKAEGLLFWPQFVKPDEMTGAYDIQIVVADEVADELADRGLRPVAARDGTLREMNGHPGLRVFRLRKNALMADKVTERPPPSVFVTADAGELVPFGGKIGNGSEGEVIFSLFEYDNKFGKGISHSLQTVVISKLVEYKSVSIEDRLKEAVSIGKKSSSKIKAKASKVDVESDEDQPF